VGETLTKLSDDERKHSESIHRKLQDLRAFFTDHALDPAANPAEAYHFFAKLKTVLGNLNNDISFVATLMAKEYLSRSFDVAGFDAAAKAQGAPGIDIEFRTHDGKRVAAEIKTTFPYQPGFGAKQREKISKDIDKLKKSDADVKFLFLTEQLSFESVKKVRAWSGAGIRVVLLPGGEELTL
jgi:hypothetical protein